MFLLHIRPDLAPTLRTGPADPVQVPTPKSQSLLLEVAERSSAPSCEETIRSPPHTCTEHLSEGSGEVQGRNSKADRAVPTIAVTMASQLPDTQANELDAAAMNGLIPACTELRHPEGAYPNPFRLAGPLMAGRANRWTEWSTRVNPGTLADLMPELDQIYDGGEFRHVMRDQEEVSSHRCSDDKTDAIGSQISGCGIMCVRI